MATHEKEPAQQEGLGNDAAQDQTILDTDHVPAAPKGQPKGEAKKEPMKKPAKPVAEEAPGQQGTDVHGPDHEHEAAHQKKNLEPGEIEHSLWDISYNTVRGPLFTLMLGGAIVLNPVLAAGIYGTKKALDLTVAKIPAVGKAYTGVKERIGKIAHGTTDLIAATATLPISALDRVEDVWETLSGKVNYESKGTVGRAMEWVTHTLFAVPGALVKGTGKALDGIYKFGKGTLHYGYDFLKHIAPVYVNHPILAPLGTLAVIGALTQMGPTAAGQAIFNTGLGVMEGLGTALKNFGLWMAK